MKRGHNHSTIPTDVVDDRTVTIEKPLVTAPWRSFGFYALTGKSTISFGERITKETVCDALEAIREQNLVDVNLNVSNEDESVQFYPEKLRFEEEWGFEDESTVHRYVADGNSVELQLSETEGQTEFDQSNAWDHLAVWVVGVNRAIDGIDHYGIEEEPGDQPAAGARTAFVLDPDGYMIELVEILDDW